MSGGLFVRGPKTIVQARDMEDAVNHRSSAQPVTPVSASGSPEDLGRNKSASTLQKTKSGALFTAINNAQSFVSTVREYKPTVKCMVVSLYGYSSLAMLEARPRVCVNKVRRCCVNEWEFCFSVLSVSECESTV